MAKYQICSCDQSQQYRAWLKELAEMVLNLKVSDIDGDTRGMIGLFSKAEESLEEIESEES